MKKKETIIQIVATVIFIISLICLHIYLDTYGLIENPTYMLFVIIGLMLIIITYSYIMISLVITKNKAILEHSIWWKLPFISLTISIVSFIGFIFLFNAGLFEGRLSNLVILFIIAFFIFVYFIFVLAIVYTFSTDKEKVVHRAYGIACIPLIFIFVLSAMMP